MDYEAALAYDASQRDSCADLSADPHGAAAPSAEGPELPVVVRWREVHEARVRAQGRLDERVVALRGQGFTEREIAPIIGRSQQTVSRRFRASVVEILRELAGLPAK